MSCTAMKTFFDVMGEQSRNVVGMRNKCQSKARLDGKVVLITGANSGIGKETAYQLSLRGAKVIIACRNLDKGENAAKIIKEKNPEANLTVMKMDLSSFTSVRQFAESVAEKDNKIDILINNAGVMMCPELQTEDGIEMQFGTNHLGHFLLTLCLLPLMKKSTNARIVTVSSKLYELGDINFENINLRNGAYTPLNGYAQSKLANILFTRELAKRLGPNSNIKSYCLHPGIIDTGLNRHLPLQWLNKLHAKMFLLNEEMGAQTTLYCTLDEGLDNESGLFYDDCKRMDKTLPKGIDDKTAAKLWELSCELVELEDHLKI